MAAIQKMVLFLRSLPLFLSLKLTLFYALKKLLNNNATVIYSQTGEDVIISTLLDKKRGFYVDVGCHDPMRLSNTFSLYLRGWSGLNIDANEALIKRFRQIRKRDLAVCAAISDDAKDMMFYEFESDAVGTLSEEVLPEWKRTWSFRGGRKVRSRTLNSLLQEHFPDGIDIDLLTVDVEGHDINVLRSIDLNVYRPMLIVVEMHHFDINQALLHDVVRYLADFEYRLVSYATMNGYFTRPGP